ncbi:hypothetical protein [Prosthecobacter sp.]|uniref:hypothetical protein n=1 Tax=Prosthecobacter sp. TaxID=1965333 RepID=UPI002488A17B|nr:hypothetical protein [Prosthecobacter sp.]MDI1314806.1 hypothetical protein [Prosthecobacter sp.]
MKHLLFSLLLVAVASSSALADSPDAILKDYRKQAAQAVERLNQSLEKAGTPLITKLVSSGDTAGAELLTSQLKIKLSGEIVPEPQASAAQLFSFYDQARTKALAPIQKSIIARIDGLLKTAGGPKLETVTELNKIRADIEVGRITPDIDWGKVWGVHNEKKDSPLNGTVTFKPDGVALRITKVGNKHPGTWKSSNKANSIEVKFPDDEWLVTSKQTGVEVRSKSLTFMIFLVPVDQTK